MSLSQTAFLFIDCQTTGMRPPQGRILEIAWSLATPEQAGLAAIHSRLIRLPDGESIPKTVARITGLDDHAMAEAVSEHEAFLELHTLIKAHPERLHCVIHYATFEKPFLTDWFERLGLASNLPFEILCSHRLSKSLLPNLPSQNLRAVAGYFGEPVSTVNRAGSHVSSTQIVWRGLCLELEKNGVQAADQIQDWAKAKPKALKPEKIEYRLEKVKRLELPDQPGVYRMLAKTGEVLYVGKATSLKSRVNSYFRGQKNRDRRKLEMLAQVWDLEVTTCNSPLEAALLENDEIKRLDPPYNVVFKRFDRRLSFYSRDFVNVSHQQSDDFPLGPFRGSGNLDSVRLLYRSIVTAEFNLPIFYTEIPEADLRQGFEIFLDKFGVKAEHLKHGIRSLLALGMGFFRHHVEETIEATENEEPEEAPEEKILTPEDVAGKYERLLRRAAGEYHRARLMTKLLDTDITWGPLGKENHLSLHHGQLRTPELPRKESPWPWLDLDIETYDRLSILISELNKHPHHVAPRKGQISP